LGVHGDESELASENGKKPPEIPSKGDWRVDCKYPVLWLPSLRGHGQSFNMFMPASL
jgi:hypothetical protein